ncbi:MAG: hypothetical protein ICV52_11390 [Microcoleus sp. C1-bin4]|nr:hypothetical protein [Microcoleus sp. C1-bin4]
MRKSTPAGDAIHVRRSGGTATVTYIIGERSSIIFCQSAAELVTLTG